MTRRGLSLDVALVTSKPRWATVSFKDGDLCEWSHHFGEAPSDAGDESLLVDLVQNVTGLTEGPLEEGPVQVRVAGIRLRRNDAEHLARMLTEAVGLIDREVRSVRRSGRASRGTKGD